ncbi:MAG: hypothetical protein ABFD50_02720 [Smithella sp.]
MTLSENTSVKIYEWGYWPLWIFAGVVARIIFQDKLFGITLFVFIGGIVAGFMPWLSSKWRISKCASRIFSVILITSIIMGVIVIKITSSPKNLNGIIGIESLVAASFIARISRWLCNQQIEHKARWRSWANGVIFIILVLWVDFALIVLIVLASKF